MSKQARAVEQANRWFNNVWTKKFW